MSSFPGDSAVLARVKQFCSAAWAPYSRRPFPTLVRLFAGRAFHGGDTADGSMDAGLAVVLIVLALPGTMVSLLLFEKYGALVRWMRGEGSFDPFTYSIPDEYFFIVLSMVVTGATAVWRWDALFLDRRDYANLVPLPIALRKIFFANFTAIVLLAAVLTCDVNAGSLVLFPVVVTGAWNSLTLFLHFGFGHAITVILASVFSFFTVFAVVGLLMALLPYSTFRKISVYVRFLMALFFLALLATGFAVPSFLAQLTQYNKNAVLALPPVWFVGICETLWGNGANPVYAGMARTAWSALGSTFFVAVASYALSFRRSFARIPETAAVAPVPRSQFRLFPTQLFDRFFLRDPAERACFHFITRTLSRSESHLQIVSAFTAMGVVLSAQTLVSYFAVASRAASRAAALGMTVRQPLSDDFLSVPFLLVFCLIAGIRFAFEMPSELRANWVFALWIDRDAMPTRAVARKVLLAFSLTPIVPLCLLSAWIAFGPLTAVLHTAIFVAATVAFVELVLLRFRKIPFTCAYPAFQSQTALTFVAYLFGFLFFTIYLPEIELWSLADPWRALVFPPVVAVALFSVRAYRQQMLDMDKQLVFEESSGPTW